MKQEGLLLRWTQQRASGPYPDPEVNPVHTLISYFCNINTIQDVKQSHNPEPNVVIIIAT
jgi:hypothetical protein